MFFGLFVVASIVFDLSNLIGAVAAIAVVLIFLCTLALIPTDRGWVEKYGDTERHVLIPVPRLGWRLLFVALPAVVLIAGVAKGFPDGTLLLISAPILSAIFAGTYFVWSSWRITTRYYLP